MQILTSVIYSQNHTRSAKDLLYCTSLNFVNLWLARAKTVDYLHAPCASKEVSILVNLVVNFHDEALWDRHHSS